jgi:hypothetical protein
MVMLIAFDGVKRPVALDRCEQLRRYLDAVFRGWRIEELAVPVADPVIAIRKKGRSYRLDTPSLGPAIHQPTEVGAICSFIADLVEVYIADQPSLLCLHSGAAAFRDGLVIFPNRFRAGKSTLLARLAASGIPVFADDVLPLCKVSRQAIALGVAPRLRLPLPKDASREFRDFIRTHSGPSDDRYLYLDLPSETLIHHGRKMPIAACVLLDRQSDGSAQLLPTLKSLGLQRAIRQNFACSIPAREIADCLYDLVTEVPCYTLCYSSLDDAATVLRETFQDRISPNHKTTATAGGRGSSPASTHRTSSTKERRGGLRRGARYRCDPAIILRAVDHDAFLVDPRNQSIYHLNTVAAGLWRLLHEPMSAADAVAALSGAFPEVDAQQIKRDVQALIVELRANKLIERWRPDNIRARH